MPLSFSTFLKRIQRCILKTCKRKQNTHMRLWTLEHEMSLWYWIQGLLATSKSYTIFFTVSPASEGDGWTFGKISIAIVQGAFSATPFPLELFFTLAQARKSNWGEQLYTRFLLITIIFLWDKVNFPRDFWQY